MSDIQTPVGLPQLLVVLILGFLVIRWIFFSSTQSSQSSRGGHTAGRSRVNPAQVEQVAQMFPQLDRRDIMWDLQRNGGNVQATTERILGGAALEVVRLHDEDGFEKREIVADGLLTASAFLSTRATSNFDACFWCG
jgi:hypothetical protein